MEFAEALKFWERALKADPSNDEAKENKQIVLDSLRDIYDISGKMKIRELAEGADNAARIESLLNEKNYLAAITEAKKCIAKGTKIPKIYWLISHAYINTEQYEEARKILHEGENKFPDYSDFYYNLAEAYSALNHTDSAIKYYALAAENEDPSDKKSVSHCLTKLGEQKSLKGENEEALLLWKKALQLNPKNKFARTCILIHKKGSLMPDMDKLKNTLDLHREFQKIQTAVYLNNNNLKKFSSDEEKNKVVSKIGSAWKSEIIPNIDIIEKLPEAGRREWFERIKIDFFNEYIFNTSADQILYEKEVNARFPYLPENGILHVYTARPALSFKGIPEDKLLNFMSGTEKPNKKEIELIRWAYEIGYRYNNQEKFQGKKLKEHLDSLSELISKKFRDKNDAGLILYKMLENNLMNK
ncbi:MAG: hypothetical protein IPL53_15105 [Ignavibacteria bacterium]|nr:hypothetical protein [Ignavibacteria bacterium]